jgi:hypothetical protein
VEGKIMDRMLVVFQVVEASPITLNQWLVRGRTLQKIQVGDTVYSIRGKGIAVISESSSDDTYAVPSRTEPLPELYPLVVVAARYAGKEFDALYRMQAGGLVLQGEEGKTLEDTKLLVQLMAR